MKRTQFYLGEELDLRLREAAAGEGRSAAAIVRDAVETYLADHRKKPTGAGDRDDPILALIGIASGGVRDGAVNHDHYLYGAPKRR